MSYKIYKFDNLMIIPCAEMEQDIGTGVVQLGNMDMPSGGSYDHFGSEYTHRPGYTLQTKGVIIGTSKTDFINQYNFLRSYLGKKAKLFRRDDLDNSHWVYARMQEIKATRTIWNQLTLEVIISFFIYSPIWNGARNGSWRLDEGEYLNSGLTIDAALTFVLTTGANSITISNDGNATLHSFEIAITPTTNPITKIILTKANQTYITWNGTLAVNTQLTINTGALSIKNNGLDAYNGLVISPTAHHIEEWLRIEPGDNVIGIAITGGDAVSNMASVSYYDGWV